MSKRRKPDEIDEIDEIKPHWTRCAAGLRREASALHRQADALERLADTYRAMLAATEQANAATPAPALGEAV